MKKVFGTIKVDWYHMEDAVRILKNSTTLAHLSLIPILKHNSEDMNDYLWCYNFYLLDENVTDYKLLVLLFILEACYDNA